jgi:hypothetical protein
MKTRRVRFATATTAVLGVGMLVGGCGSQHAEHAAASAHASQSVGQSGQSGQAHKHHDGMAMDMSDLSDMDGPSATAAMICSDETRDAVRRTFELSSAPRPADSWDRQQMLYTCRYDVHGSRLTLSVQDAMDVGTGRRYFDRLRSRLTDAHRIRGVQALGFPSYQSARGQVVFLKDGKTLDVDASRVPASALPKGFSRAEVAYGVASGVIACWTE